METGEFQKRQNEWTVLSKVEDLCGFSNVQDLFALFSIEQEQDKAGAKNRTMFFVCHGIWLRSTLDCANVLKDRQPGTTVYVRTSHPFPYCHSEDRVVTGIIQGQIGGRSQITKVHLDNTQSENCLPTN